MRNDQPQPNRFPTLLEGLLAGVRRRLWVHGWIRFGAVAIPAVTAAAWAVGGLQGPGGFIGWGLSLSLLLVIVTAARQFLWRPLKAVRRPRQLVSRVETEGRFGNLLVAAEEADRAPGRWSGDHPVKVELRRRLNERAADIVAILDPSQIFPMRFTRTAQAMLAVSLLVFGIWSAVQPAEVRRGMERLLSPQPEVPIVPVGGIFAQTGPENIVVGQDLKLSALDFAAGQEPTVCEIRFGRGSWQPFPAAQVPVYPETAGLPASHRSWSVTIEEIRENFSWRFRRESIVSAERQVNVLHHPLVTRLSATVKPPAYTGLPDQVIERMPTWLELPVGSTIFLHCEVNQPIQTADLEIENGEPIRFEGGTILTAGVRVDSTLSFVVNLEDAHGLHNPSPMRYEIAAAADEDPVIRLVRDQDDGILPLSGEIRLVVEARDDYGLAAMKLLARIPTAAGATAAGSDQAGWWEGAIWPSADEGSIQVETVQGPLRIELGKQEDAGTGLHLLMPMDVLAGELDLVAGDVLELMVEVQDNRQPGPRGRARSEVVRLALPSAAEILTTQAEASQEKRSELEEMRRRSQQLDADLDRLTRELMKNPIPDWARQQEMESAIDRQQALQKELARVAEQLRQELEKLAGNQLTSEAQLEKAEQMSELLDQPASDQLSDMIERMGDEQGQVSPDEVARAMDEVARNQKEMARRLDAALAMLKRMAQEQNLEGLTSLLEQMIRKQQELADLSRQLAEAEAAEAEGDQKARDQEDGETEDGNQSEGDQQSSDSSDSSEEDSEQGQQGQDNPPMPTAEELARRQEALAKEMEQLQEKLEEALAALQEDSEEGSSEASDQLAEAMEQALEQVKKQMESGNMESASEQLQQMDPGQAAEMQQQALRDLGSLYHVLMETQEAMQMAMKMEQVSSLRGLAADMLALSTRQEEISMSIPPNLRDLRSLGLTRNQHRLQKAAAGVRDNLSELMDEAPNRIMKLLAKVDELLEQMGSALRAMEENRAPMARREAQASLASANRIVIGLLTEAQMSSNQGGGSGSSTPSVSEQMKQMAKEQAALNGTTEELRRMLADRGISQEARSRMERLGQAQADLARRMGDLAEEETERPEGERILGDLTEMEKDMERIGREIDDGLVSEETLVRQERILSRMLDARNAARTRDFSKKRESRTSDRLYVSQEGRTGPGLIDQEDPFRLRYQPLEKAPLEYRDLVRRYFEALDALGRLESESGTEDGKTEGSVP